MIKIKKKSAFVCLGAFIALNVAVFNNQTQKTVSAAPTAPTQVMTIESKQASTNSLDEIAEQLVRELVGDNFDDLVVAGSCHLVVPTYSSSGSIAGQNEWVTLGLEGKEATAAVGTFEFAPFTHVNSSSEYSFLNPLDKLTVQDMVDAEVDSIIAGGGSVSATEKAAIYAEKAEAQLFTSGVVLSTGDVTKIKGPNIGLNATVSKDAITAFSDDTTNAEDLLQLIEVADPTIKSYDTIRLTFDFKPAYNNVSFQYVFGSEEYPLYVGEDFNDVFAFYIDEVQSDGTVATKTNYAKLPESEVVGKDVVSINNVNNGNTGNSTLASNSAYYVSNNRLYNNSGEYLGEVASEPGINSDDNALDSSYNGFTKVLTAVNTKLEAGTVYRMEFAITDIGDSVVDSAVFLASNSFKVTPDMAMEYHNFDYPLTDLGELDKDKVVNQAGLTVGDTANGGLVAGDYSFDDPSQLDALKNNPEAKPYPLDMTFTPDNSGGTSLPEITQRIWVFPTTKNTKVDKTTNRVIYGDDYSIPLYEASYESKDDVYAKGNIRVYDFSSEDTANELPTLADKNNTTGLNISDMTVITSATGASVVQPEVTYTEGSKVTTTKIDVTITGEVLFHVRQVVYDDSSKLVVPSDGYVEFTNTAATYNAVVPSGKESTNPAYDDVILTLEDSGNRYVDITTIVPSYYKYMGYEATNDVTTAHNSANLTAGTYRFDMAGGAYEKWITLYLQPSTAAQPKEYSWSYKLNTLGNIEAEYFKADTAAVSGNLLFAGNVSYQDGISQEMTYPANSEITVDTNINKKWQLKATVESPYDATTSTVAGGYYLRVHFGTVTNTGGDLTGLSLGSYVDIPINGESTVATFPAGATGITAIPITSVEVVMADIPAGASGAIFSGSEFTNLSWSCEVVN